MLNVKQQDFVNHAYKMFGKEVLTIDELKQANKKFGCKYPPQWLTKNKDFKVDTKKYKLPLDGDLTVTKTETEKVLDTQVNETKTEAAYVVSSLTGNIVPKKDPVFVSFGNYPDIKSIIKSGKFYPVFITGLLITQLQAEMASRLRR